MPGGRASYHIAALARRRRWRSGTSAAVETARSRSGRHVGRRWPAVCGSSAAGVHRPLRDQLRRGECRVASRRSLAGASGPPVRARPARTARAATTAVSAVVRLCPSALVRSRRWSRSLASSWGLPCHATSQGLPAAAGGRWARRMPRCQHNPRVDCRRGRRGAGGGARGPSPAAHRPRAGRLVAPHFVGWARVGDNTGAAAASWLLCGRSPGALADRAARTSVTEAPPGPSMVDAPGGRWNSAAGRALGPRRPDPPTVAWNQASHRSLRDGEVRLVTQVWAQRGQGRDEAEEWSRRWRGRRRCRPVVWGDRRAGRKHRTEAARVGWLLSTGRASGGPLRGKRAVVWSVWGAAVHARTHPTRPPCRHGGWRVPPSSPAGWRCHGRQAAAETNMAPHNMSQDPRVGALGKGGGCRGSREEGGAHAVGWVVAAGSLG